MKNTAVGLCLVSSIAACALHANELTLDQMLQNGFASNAQPQSITSEYYSSNTYKAFMDNYYTRHNDEPVDLSKLKQTGDKQSRAIYEYAHFRVEADRIYEQNGKRMFAGFIRIKAKSGSNYDILHFSNSEDRSGHDIMVEEKDGSDVFLRPYDLLGNSAALYAAYIKRQDRGTATGNESIMLTRKRDFGFFPNKAERNLILWNPSLMPIMDGVSGLLPGIIGFTTFGFDFKSQFIRPIFATVGSDQVTIEDGAMIGVNLSAIFGANWPVVGVPMDKGTIVLSQNPNNSRGKVDLAFTKLLGMGAEQAVNFSKKKPDNGTKEGNFVTNFFTSKYKENKGKVDQFMDTVTKTGQPSAEQSAALGGAVNQKDAGSKPDVMGGLVTFLKESQIWIDPVQRDVGMRAEIDLSSIRLAQLGLMAGFRFYNNYLLGPSLDTPVLNNFGVYVSKVSPELFKLTAEPMVRLTQAATAGTVGIGLGLTNIHWDANNLAPIFVAGNWNNFNTSMSMGVALADSYDIGYNFYKIFGFHLLRLSAGVKFDMRQYAQLTLNGDVEIINVPFAGGMLEAQFARPYVKTEVYSDLGKFIGVPGLATGYLGAGFESSTPLNPAVIAWYRQMNWPVFDEQYMKGSGWAKVNVQVPRYIPIVGGIDLGGANVDITGTFRKANNHDLRATASLRKPWWLFFLPDLTFNLRILPKPVEFGIKVGRSLAEGLGDQTLTIGIGGDITGQFTLGGKNRAVNDSYEHPEDTEYLAVEVYGANNYPKINVTTPGGEVYEFAKLSYATTSAPPSSEEINATTAFFTYDAANKATIFSIKNAKKGVYKIELVNAAESGESRVVASKPNDRPNASFENIEAISADGEAIAVTKTKSLSFDMQLSKDAKVGFYLAKANDISAADEMGYEEQFDNFVAEDEVVDTENDGDFEYQDYSDMAVATDEVDTEFGIEGSAPDADETPVQTETTMAADASANDTDTTTSDEEAIASDADTEATANDEVTERKLRSSIKYAGRGILVPAKSAREMKFRTFRSSDATTIDMTKDAGDDSRYVDKQDIVNYDTGHHVMDIDAKAGLNKYTVEIDAGKLENGEYRLFAKVSDDKHAPTFRVLDIPIQIDYDAAPTPPKSVTTENADSGLKVKWEMDTVTARSKKRSEREIDESIKLNPGYKIYAFVEGKRKPKYVMEYTPENIQSKTQEYVIEGLDTATTYNIGVASLDDLGLESDIVFAANPVKRSRTKRSLDSDGSPELRVVMARTQAKAENGEVQVGFTVFNNGTADVVNAKVKMYYGIIKESTRFAEFNLSNISKKGHKDIKLKVPASFIKMVNANKYASGTEPKIYYVFDDVQPKTIKAALNSGALSVENASSLPRSYALTPSSGWNLLANPTASAISDFSVFGDYTSLWVYAASGWKKALKSSNVNEIGSIPPQTGFWLNTKAPKNVSIEGLPNKFDASKLTTGWNLIGSGERLDNFPTTCPQCKSVFVFRGGAYEKDPYYVESGEGFWANVK